MFCSLYKTIKKRKYEGLRPIAYNFLNKTNKLTRSNALLASNMHI